MSSVVVEDLVDCCGGGVGRDEEHAHGRFLGFFEFCFAFSGGVVLGQPAAVVHGLGFAYLPEAVVDGLDEVAAEGESSFA